MSGQPSVHGMLGPKQKHDFSMHNFKVNPILDKTDVLHNFITMVTTRLMLTIAIACFTKMTD